MYSSELAAATSNAVMVSILVVVAAFFVYFIVSRRADIFGAVLLMLLTAFMAKNYYYIVYGAGAMLFLATVAYITDYDEGTLSGAFWWAGIGLFASLIMFYIMPETVKFGDSLEGMDLAFIAIVLIPSMLIVLVSEWKGKFSFEWESALAILIPVGFALAMMGVVGATHILWGAALMVFGIILEYNNAGFVSTVAFLSGFMIWLDDAVAYYLYHQNMNAWTIMFPIGLGLIVLYLYLLLWGD